MDHNGSVHKRGQRAGSPMATQDLTRGVSPAPRVVLLLDLDSSAIRVSQARIVPGVAFRVDREKPIQARQANGGPDLPASAVRDTIKAVRAYLQDLRAEGDVPVLVVASAAMRGAAGAAHLLDQLRREEGVEVRVMSGGEEGRLGAIAACGNLPDLQALIADLGDTSLQLTSLQEREIRTVAQVSLGAVHTSHRFLKHDPPTPAEVRALRREVRQRVRDVMPGLGGGTGVVGLGGHVQALGRLHLRAIWDRRVCLHGLRLQLTDVAAIRERVEGLLSPPRGKLNGQAARRGKTLLAAAVVFEELMALGGCPALRVCVRGAGYGFLIAETFGGAPRA